MGLCLADVQLLFGLFHVILRLRLSGAQAQRVQTRFVRELHNDHVQFDVLETVVQKAVGAKRSEPLASLS